MKIAVKFQSQNPNNAASIPDYWPWKKLDIEDDSAASFESEGWTIFSRSEYATYLFNKKITLDNHFTAQIQDQYKFLETTNERKIAYANELIERLKKKNILEGINAFQGFHMHERTRQLPVSFYGKNYTIDLMNLVISGDLELACLALMHITPDDMTQTDHWLSAERLAWIITELKKFLEWP